jgi:hypothetical protein
VSATTVLTEHIDQASDRAVFRQIADHLRFRRVERGGGRVRLCWACWPGCRARTAGRSPNMQGHDAGWDAPPAGAGAVGRRWGPG